MQLDKMIIEKGLEDIKKFEEASKLEANELKAKIIRDAKSDCELKLKNVKREIERELKTKEKLLEFERRQAELVAKQEIIENIFRTLVLMINDLCEESLLNYIIKLIKNEGLVGNEVLYTNNDQYEKYLRALSSENDNKKDVIFLDKINDILKTNFKMASKKINIKNGFIMEGEFFDFNFTTDEIIGKLRDKYERKIAIDLFK